jgi:hypothetical protein
MAMMMIPHQGQAVDLRKVHHGSVYQLLKVHFDQMMRFVMHGYFGDVIPPN